MSFDGFVSFCDGPGAPAIANIQGLLHCAARAVPDAKSQGSPHHAARAASAADLQSSPHNAARVALAANAQVSPHHEARILEAAPPPVTPFIIPGENRPCKRCEKLILSQGHRCHQHVHR